jgi:cyclophilin family peptidyl-prolyl cis-trans isomerase
MNASLRRLAGAAFGAALLLAPAFTVSTIATASDRSSPPAHGKATAKTTTDPKPAAPKPKTTAKTASTKAAPAKAATPAKKTGTAAAKPAAAAIPADPLVVLETSAGDIVIDLYEDKTPGHAENFKKLVQQGYYDGSPFHRVIDGFMAQGGGKFGANGETVDVGYTIPAEIVPGLTHKRGAVAAARTGDQVNPQRASSGSQFYICFADASWLDNQYSIFGEVVSGMENVDKLQKGAPGSGAVDPADASVIKHAYLKAKS